MKTVTANRRRREAQSTATVAAAWLALCGGSLVACGSTTTSTSLLPAASQMPPSSSAPVQTASAASSCVYGGSRTGLVFCGHVQITGSESIDADFTDSSQLPGTCAARASSTGGVNGFTLVPAPTDSPTVELSLHDGYRGVGTYTTADFGSGNVTHVTSPSDDNAYSSRPDGMVTAVFAGDGSGHAVFSNFKQPDAFGGGTVSGQVTWSCIGP